MDYWLRRLKSPRMRLWSFVETPISVSTLILAVFTEYIAYLS